MDIAGWERMYSAGERGKEDAPTILLEEISQTLARGSAIDLACGTGRNALYLAGCGWDVTAIDGSEKAIQTVKLRAAAHGLPVHASVADLTAAEFQLQASSFDLVVIAFYLQRNLFDVAKLSLRPGGVMIAIVHIPDPGEEWNAKRAAPGELRSFFEGWEILWDYEGASRDPAHRRAVAEIAARRSATQPFSRSEQS